MLHFLTRKSKNIPQRKLKPNYLDKKEKYGKTGLTPSFSLELKSKLEYVMLTQKIYLNPNLKLDDIATVLNVSRHHASQVINENFNVSFYDYINAYRIKDVKYKLSLHHRENKSISDLAYECGFNNRVSFYNAFNKMTSMTPKQFIQKKNKPKTADSL
ncbi:MAG: helix-turn-helix domain-containing protein [Bacteroidota bacterium]